MLRMCPINHKITFSETTSLKSVISLKLQLIMLDVISTTDTLQKQNLLFGEGDELKIDPSGTIIGIL